MATVAARRREGAYARPEWQKDPGARVVEAAVGLCVCCTIQRELWRMSEVWGMRRARQVQRASESLR